MRIWLVMVLLLCSTPASARLTVSMSLGTIDGAKVAVVGTVLSSKVKATTQRGNQRIETLEVRVRVALSLKGSKRGAKLDFTHFRAKTTGPTLNGFSYAELKKGRAYLLVFTSKKKTLQLYAPEDQLVELPAAVRRVASKLGGASPVQKAVALLHASVQSCKMDCNRGIWLLSRAPKAARLSKKTMVALLRPLARKSMFNNTRLAAYAVLGSHGETALIPEIVAFISGKGSRSDHRSNAISWLQGFSSKRQIRALKQILKRTTDPLVKRTANYRLKHLSK